jgi:hypothetical protein
MEEIIWNYITSALSEGKSIYPIFIAYGAYLLFNKLKDLKLTSFSNIVWYFKSRRKSHIERVVEANIEIQGLIDDLRRATGKRVLLNAYSNGMGELHSKTSIKYSIYRESYDRTNQEPLKNIVGVLEIEDREVLDMIIQSIQKGEFVCHTDKFNMSLFKRILISNDTQYYYTMCLNSKEVGGKIYCLTLLLKSEPSESIIKLLSKTAMYLSAHIKNLDKI